MAVQVFRCRFDWDLRVGNVNCQCIYNSTLFHVPQRMQAPGTTGLDPTIRRVKWVFKKQYASDSTTAKRESFMGVYSIWFKDLRTSPDHKTLSQMDGEFWMMKQMQYEPERGDTIK